MLADRQKHRKTIMAWANGADIEFYDRTAGVWKQVPRSLTPVFDNDCDYRVKENGIMGCNNDCNQGRTCDQSCQTARQDKHKQSDRWFKWFIVFSILYIIAHTSLAYCQVVFKPDGTVVTCRPTSFGTVVCI